MLDLEKLMQAAKSGVPYAQRPDAVPVTPGAWAALARASGIVRDIVTIGGEHHMLAARQRDGLFVLAVGEYAPGGPIDPDFREGPTG
jgi:hypothetical protein